MVEQQCLLTPNLGLRSTAQAGQEDASPYLIMGGWVVKKNHILGGSTTYIYLPQRCGDPHQERCGAFHC